MTKLLDFQPPANEDNKPDLARLLTMDVCYGLTPDLPKLRYAGPQTVFIWDEMKSSSHMSNTLGLESEVDFETKHYNVYTKNSYRPFENFNKDDVDEYQFFLPYDPDWCKGFEVSAGISIMRHVVARPVQGRLLQCNLRTMQALDMWYRNRERFVRTMLPVTYFGKGGDKEVWVWAYVNMTTRLGKYDPHEQKYKMPAHINPRTVRVVNSANSSAYEVDAYRATAKLRA